MTQTRSPTTAMKSFVFHRSSSSVDEDVSGSTNSQPRDCQREDEVTELTERQHGTAKDQTERSADVTE